MNEVDFLDKYYNYSKGYVIDIFKDGKDEEFIFGYMSIFPNKIKATSDTLYDIASLTKVFTSTLIYMAYEEGKIDLNDIVFNVDNNFINLKSVKIIDLLSHNQNIWTNGYLGSAKNREDFYNILYTAYVKENIPTYVDIHYIILSTLLEKIYGTDYKTLCTNKIFNKLNLKSASFNPDETLCASNNYEHIEDKIVEDIEPGLIHDIKARVAKSFGIYLGHASIFITGKDLLKFLKSFFDYSLLKKDTINLMLKHRETNTLNYKILKEKSTKLDINEMYEEVVNKDSNFKAFSTINNMGVLYKNNINQMNDIPRYADENSIFFSGYTGPMFLIDFKNKIILVIMCNAIHDSYFNREQRKKLEIEIINYCYNMLVKKR